jgi:predicted acyl esterase
MDARAAALRMDGPAEVVELPASRPADHGVEASWNVSLRDDGGADVTGEERASGDDAFWMRTQLTEPGARQSWVEAHLAATWLSTIQVGRKIDFDGDELARIFRQYSLTVPDFRSPQYAEALNRATLQAPSGHILRRLGSPLTGYETFMADGPASPAWKDVDLINASHTGATPSININGWMDDGAHETVKLFEFQQHHPDQYLIMAPTEHCRMLATGPEARLGQRPMGDTRFPYDEIIIAWFDRFLCDEPDAWRPMPKVQVFLMGAGTWLSGESWPLPESETRTLFLASDESASTLWGDGALVPAARGAGIDEFIADPHNPVQSLGGDLATHDPIFVDQRAIECRPMCSCTARPC